VAVPKIKARFVEPMLLQRCAELPEGREWLIELKLDGYRAVAFKTGGRVQLRSRNNNDFTSRYGAIAKALADIPNETAIDGEIVALDASGHPSFHSLQNSSSSKTTIVYYAFDVMILRGVDVMQQDLTTRRELLYEHVLSELADPIRLSPELEGSMRDLVQSVKAQKLEGLIAKRRNSIYVPGDRGGAWRKMRINDGQEFVIGGYRVAGNSDLRVLRQRQTPLCCSHTE
jgi:ATP-dependent DNA ligase